jgi:hypothetical protein
MAKEKGKIMRSDLDQVAACPHCQGLAKYRTIQPGNSVGTRIWTDGRRIAPMRPSPPAVVQCRHCAESYWLTEAKEIGTIRIGGEDPGAEKSAWKEAEYVVEASEEGYYTALEAKLARDRALEKVLRTFVWWRGNNADRECAPEEEGTETAYPEAFRSNLTALTLLFNVKSTGERIMKAEAMRELGEYEEALELLNGIQERDYDAVVRFLRDLCNRADATVREIVPSP